MEDSLSIQEQVYHSLRKKILELVLAPGTVISPQELAGRMKISRTPIREALIRLQRDGLVVMTPQRETIVSRINMVRVRQERFMRISLELSAIKLFVEDVSFKHLTHLAQLIDKQLEAGVTHQFEKMLEYDDQYHRVFFEAVSQSLSWYLLEDMNTHYRRVRLLSLQSIEIAEKTVLQHVEILKALESKPPGGVYHLLEQHLLELDVQEAKMYHLYPDYFD